MSLAPSTDSFEGALPGVDAIERAFQDAASTTATSDHWFRLGGASVHVRVVGSRLVPPMTRALDHLAIAPQSTADLVIACWDADATGIAPPLPPVDESLRAASVSVPSDGGPTRWGSPVVVADISGGWCLWRPGIDAFSAVAAGARRAWHWVGAADRVQYWDVSAPFKAIIHRWARQREMQLVHAAAVATNDAAALLVGMPGAGKSTTALACVEAGLSYIGDDYVLVEAGASPTVYSVSCAAKLEPSQARSYPRLMPTIWNEARLDTEKAVAFMEPSATAADRSLRALLVPEVTGKRQTQVVPETASAALFALAPSTIVQMPGSREGELASLAELVRCVPAYRLELGTDLGGVAAAIEAVL